MADEIDFEGFRQGIGVDVTFKHLASRRHCIQFQICFPYCDFKYKLNFKLINICNYNF